MCINNVVSNDVDEGGDKGIDRVDNGANNESVTVKENGVNHGDHDSDNVNDNEIDTIGKWGC